MKKILFSLFLTLVSTFVYAQKDVTKFLGIPVDGLKSEMIKKLQAKGYVYNREGDYLKGEFNGANVNIFIVTNNNKVWRIILADEFKTDETSVKIRFNNLVRQFEKNERYLTLRDSDYTIPANEDISYGISVKSKRYEACYFQAPNPADSLERFEKVTEYLKSQFTDEQLADTTTLMQDLIKLNAQVYFMELWQKKSVWFMISELYGKYFITMFYDNEWNHSDGEDL